MPVLALADIAVIIFALILLLAIALLKRTIVQLVPDIHIPLIGSLRDKVNGGLDSAFNAVKSFADASIGLLWHAITTTAGFLYDYAKQALSYVEQSAQTLSWIVTTFVPRETGKIRTVIATKVTNLKDDIAHELSVAEHYAKTEIASLAKTVKHDLSVAEKYTVKEVKKAETATANVLSAAEHYAVSKAEAAEAAAKAAATAALTLATKTLHAAITDVTNAVTALDGTLTADVTALGHEVATITSTTIPAIVQGIDGAIEDEASKVIGAVGAAVAGVEAALGTDLADVKAWLDKISLADVTDIAGLTSLVLAVTGVLTQIATDCIVPSCKNLGGLGGLLKDLLGGLESGALLAFLVEVAQNPAAAAGDIDTVLGPLATSATTAVRSLLAA